MEYVTSLKAPKKRVKAYTRSAKELRARVRAIRRESEELAEKTLRDNVNRFRTPRIAALERQASAWLVVYRVSVGMCVLTMVALAMKIAKVHVGV